MGIGTLSGKIMAMTSEEFWKILYDAPQDRPVIYRLYHDAQGYPLAYSMEDMPGLYIEIDHEVYIRNSSHVRVIGGKLTKVTRSVPIMKLKPETTHGTPCHPQDICVVVSDLQLHTKWGQKYED